MADALKKELDEDCALATRIMRLMTHPPIYGSVKPDPLKPEQIRDCKALAFMDILKGGIGVTLARGSGFVVKKLPGGEWSAPYFFKVQQVGVGITFGVDKIDCVLVMTNEKNIEKLATGDGMQFGADLWVTSVGAGGLGHAMMGSGEGEVSRLDDNADKLWAYQQGLMVGNIAINGTETRTDTEKNAKVHGKGTSAATVLSAPASSDEVKAAFAPLVQLLRKIEANEAEDVAPIPEYGIQAAQYKN